MSAIPKPRKDQVPPTAAGYRFSIEQYHRMIETGVLTENDRVELLDGRILPKMTHNPPHDLSVLLVQTEFLTRVTADWVVRIQSAITIGDSEPEPDAVVARGPARRYGRLHPTSKDIGVLAEVSESSLDFAQTVKAPEYARAGIAIYWIVNLINARVEVYTQPKQGRTSGYHHCAIYKKKDSVPLMVAGRNLGNIPVRNLLP